MLDVMLVSIPGLDGLKSSSKIKANSLAVNEHVYMSSPKIKKPLIGIFVLILISIYE